MKLKQIPDVRTNVHINSRDILVDPTIKKPDAPVMFLKPTSSYITEGEDIHVRRLYFTLF